MAPFGLAITFKELRRAQWKVYSQQTGPFNGTPKLGTIPDEGDSEAIAGRS